MEDDLSTSSEELKYEKEIDTQRQMAKQLDESWAQRMRETLSDFDRVNDTLIDYFAIMGPDHDSLIKLICEINEDDHVVGSEYDESSHSFLGDQSETVQMFEESKGLHRVLFPSVIARFPQIDRHATEFPFCIDDYFFDCRETVITAEKKKGLSLNPYESMGLVDRRNGHVYVTTHMFLEDLRDVKKNLVGLVPPHLKAKYDQKEMNRGEYFVKKGFCLVTSGYPASQELNRINVFLRRLCTSQRMFGQFEEYLARLLFEVPLPIRSIPVSLQLHLPSLKPIANGDGEKVTEDENILCLSLPGRSELPLVNEEAINGLFRCLSADKILRLLRYMILDERIVLISHDRNLIVHCCEALRCLLFPLRYEHSASNWYSPYTPVREYYSTDWAFPALIGLDKKLLSVAEVQEVTTWVVDLDTDVMWQPRGRKINLKTETSPDKIKPEFPEELSQNLLSQKMMEKAVLTSDEVREVRGCFFEFFCQLLKHLKKGIQESEWKSFDRQRKNIPRSADPSFVFNQQSFLEAYHNNEADFECIPFLQVFVERSAFQSLIELWADQKDQGRYRQDSDIFVFKQRLKQLSPGKVVAPIESFASNQIAKKSLATDRQRKVVHCYPFYQIMERARIQELQESSEERKGGDLGANMARYECRTVVYWTTPQFLDYQLLIKLFINQISKAVALSTFKEQSKMLYPQQEDTQQQFSQSAKPVATKQQMFHSLRQYGYQPQIKMTRREELQDCFDLKTDHVNILFCWLLVWCGSFKSQHKHEMEFLLLQAIQVIKKSAQKGDEDLSNFILLMLNVTFGDGHENFVKFLVELWKIDLKLPLTQSFTTYDFKANERNTTFHVALSRRQKEAERRTVQQVREGADDQNIQVCPQVLKDLYARKKVVDVQHATENDLVAALNKIAEKQIALTSGQAVDRKAGGGNIKRFIFGIKRKFTSLFETQQPVGDQLEVTPPPNPSRKTAVAIQDGFSEEVSEGIKKLGKMPQSTKNVPLFMLQKTLSAPSPKSPQPFLLTPEFYNEVSTGKRIEEEFSSDSSSFTDDDLSFEEQKKPNVSTPEGGGGENSPKLPFLGTLKKKQLPTSPAAGSASPINKPLSRDSRGGDNQLPALPTLSKANSKNSSRQSQINFLNKVNGVTNTLHTMKNRCMDDIFVNANHKEYQRIKSHLNLPPRTFLLPEEQLQLEDFSNQVVVTLEHPCANPICKKLNNADDIMINGHASYSSDKRSGTTKRHFHWNCFNCSKEIKPILKVRVSQYVRSRKQEKVTLFHPAQLRNLIEVYLMVDDNYLGVKQRSLQKLRENKKLFWNMIYYFSRMGFPYEFLIPYQLKETYQTTGFDLASKITLQQRIQLEGSGFLDAFCRTKIKRKKESMEKSLAKKHKTLVTSNAKAAEVAAVNQQKSTNCNLMESTMSIVTVFDVPLDASLRQTRKKLSSSTGESTSQSQVSSSLKKNKK